MSQRNIALITGSTDGLGRAVARKLALAGTAVLIHGRSQERGERLVSEIRADGGTATFYEADFASLAAAENSFTLRRATSEEPIILTLIP